MMNIDAIWPVVDRSAFLNSDYDLRVSSKIINDDLSLSAAPTIYLIVVEGCIFIRISHLDLLTAADCEAATEQEQR
nr:unnamed protein product [Leishmania braziliensis]CAJ2472352.1 unnamed protein product [Leishmania braziliensis]